MQSHTWVLGYVVDQMARLKVTVAEAAFSDQVTVTFGSLTDPSFHRRSLGNLGILFGADFPTVELLSKLKPTPAHQALPVLLRYFVCMLCTAAHVPGYGHTCKWVHTHVCSRMWRPKADVRYLTRSFSTLPFKVGSLAEPRSHQFWPVQLASLPQGSLPVPPNAQI